MFNHNYISECLDRYKSLPLNRTISKNETMFDKWYWEVGESAVEVIFSALAASFLSNVQNVLDIPCGHGRVLRHLTNLFPEANFTVSDLDKDGIEFCAETFGA